MVNQLKGKLDLNYFPKWKLDAGNVNASFQAWRRQFDIAIGVTTLNLGRERVDKTLVDVFRGRRKLLALLSAIGSDGIETLLLRL